GTGWSRAAKPDGANAFWHVDRDAESLAKTIALWLANNGRSGSPKFLLGESYGGFRATLAARKPPQLSPRRNLGESYGGFSAAKVARALQREQSIAVSGMFMVSPLVESGLIFGGARFALGAATMNMPETAML